MSSFQKNLAEVPNSVLRTPTITSRLPHLNLTPRSGSKLPINPKSAQSKIPMNFRTPTANTPSSRLTSNFNSNKSTNASIIGSAKSNIPPPRTPSLNRQPVTPSIRNPLNRGFNSARAAPVSNTSIYKSLIPKTPSTFNSRLTAASNLHTPKRTSNLLDTKKISRTVDCAKSIKRRSIKILNQSANRLSFLNEMESGCVLITPKLFRHLMSKNTSKVEESIMENDETENLNEDDLKVRTIDPNNLFKLLNKQDTQKKQESIKVEITVNLNSGQNQNEPVKIQVDTQKIEDAVNENDNDKLSAKLNEISAEILEKCVEKQKETSSDQVDELKEAELKKPMEPCDPQQVEVKDIEPAEATESVVPQVVESSQVLILEVKDDDKSKIEENKIETPYVQEETTVQGVNSVEISKDCVVDESTNNSKPEVLVETIQFEISEDEDQVENDEEVEQKQDEKEPEIIQDKAESREDEVQEVCVETNDIPRSEVVIEIEKVENYECKEISLQTDFQDESVLQPAEEHKVMEAITETIEEKKQVEVIEVVQEENEEPVVEQKGKARAVSKPRRGRKVKQQVEKEVETDGEISNEKSDENNENNPEEVKNVKPRRGRKPKEVVEQDDQPQVKRVLTRAQRAKLADKN